MSDRMHRYQDGFPPTAPPLIAIERRGVLHEYQCPMPPEEHVMRYPHIESDTEKIARKLRGGYLKLYPTIMRNE